MKKILLLLVSIVSFSVYSQTFTPKNWVTDLGNFYTPEEEVYLNKKISDYEKLTSIEIVNVPLLTSLYLDWNKLTDLYTILAKGQIINYNFSQNLLSTQEINRLTALGFESMYMLPQST